MVQALRVRSGPMVASIPRRDIDDGDARTPLQGDQLLRARIMQFVRVPRETVASHRGWLEDPVDLP